MTKASSTNTTYTIQTQYTKNSKYGYLEHKDEWIYHIAQYDKLEEAMTKLKMFNERFPEDNHRIVKVEHIYTIIQDKNMSQVDKNQLDLFGVNVL